MTHTPYTWRDFVRIGAGIVMLILGLLGLVLPVLQGILFLLISALLLAPYSRWVRSWLQWSEQRFPNAHRQAERFKDKFKKH